MKRISVLLFAAIVFVTCSFASLTTEKTLAKAESDLSAHNLVQNSQGKEITDKNKTIIDVNKEKEAKKETKSEKEVITVEATAYTANCAGCSGITRTGINLNKNRHAKVIAVDPNVIPLGTKVYVEGYGEAIAGDTGGAIKGHRIDLHVPTKDIAKNWGRRTVQVTILG